MIIVVSIFTPFYNIDILVSAAANHIFLPLKFAFFNYIIESGG